MSDTPALPDASRPLPAACHCGAVRFTVLLDGGWAAARRCNCSYCRMRGAVALSARLADIAVQQGQDMLTRYQFNTGQAQHFFCSRCGIYTFHQRRSRPDQYGVNAACLEGVSPFDFAQVPVMEGRTHPRDRADASTGPQVAGWLDYRATEPPESPESL